MLIRNRSASSYRSGVTAGISVFMERKTPCKAPATLGGVGDSDSDVFCSVLAAQALSRMVQTPHLPNTTFVTREGSQGSPMGTLECSTQECHVPNRWHVLGDRWIRAKGGFRVTLLLCHRR